MNVCLIAMLSLLDWSSEIILRGRSRGGLLLGRACLSLPQLA